MTEFKDFKPFFDAMIAEMKRHDPEEGDSWRDDKLEIMINSPDNTISIPMDECLKMRLEHAFESYTATGSLDELVDIANLCAMLWLRHKEREEQVNE